MRWDLIRSAARYSSRPTSEGTVCRMLAPLMSEGAAGAAGLSPSTAGEHQPRCQRY